MSLDSRVTTLEENVGNSSVAQMEVKVESLEGTTADHETSISSLEADVNGRYYGNVQTLEFALKLNKNYGTGSFLFKIFLRFKWNHVGARNQNDADRRKHSRYRNFQQPIIFYIKWSLF